MLSGVMAACESRGQRLALLAANICLFPIPGMHSFGPGLAPARTPEEQALHDEIRQGLISMLDTGLDGLNRARIALGLLPVQHVTDQLEAADLHLLGTSRAFDFPVARLPEGIHYVGPQLDEPAWAEPWVSPWPARDPRPMIAVGFSTTFQNHAGVIQKIVDAAADLPVRTLVTLGSLQPEEVRAPRNAVLLQSAPHDAVMREASIVVTHGGHGTVTRALVQQRPLLVIPHGRDQGDNAIRVTERGAGLSLPNTATQEEIAQALRRLLEDPSLASAARQLGSAIAEEMRNSPVVPLLEEPATRRNGYAMTALDA